VAVTLFHAEIYGRLLMYMQHPPAPLLHMQQLLELASIRPRSALWSAAHGILFILRSRLELGKRVFTVAGPACWKNLPDSVSERTNT